MVSIGSRMLGRRGAECVVDGGFCLGPVDLALDAGSVTIVAGANGSSKTTLLRVGAGLLPLSAGRRVCGGLALYLQAGGGGRDGQRVAAAVEFAGALAGRRPVDAGRVLADVGIVGLAGRRVGTLSAGERARLTVAVASAARPTLLCLDETFAPLDAAGTRAAEAAVSRLAAAGIAVVVASPRFESLADRADTRLIVTDATVGLG